MKPGALSKLRKEFHAALLRGPLTADDSGIPSNADKDNRLSRDIARSIIDQIGPARVATKLKGQTSGRKFEEICAGFVEASFTLLGHLRPGKWEFYGNGLRKRIPVSFFEQYGHLSILDELVRADSSGTLAAHLGSDYLIYPDIVVARKPEEDGEINGISVVVDGETARLAALRKSNNDSPIMHASISCKFTIRSDRAQNARSEALNLLRNRKGRVPHIAVITAEPLPSRLASLSLGTGDIDCVYHFALHELQAALAGTPETDAHSLLQSMIVGKRLRDISDLPLDLAI